MPITLDIVPVSRMNDGLRFALPTLPSHWIISVTPTAIPASARNRANPVRAPRNVREHDLGIFRGYPIMLGAAKVSGGQLVHELIRNLRSVLPFA